MMTANLHPERQPDGQKGYGIRADVVDTSPPFAALTIKSGSDHITFFFDDLEQIAAFGRAIEREAEVCMAESQAEEVA